MVARSKSNLTKNGLLVAGELFVANNYDWVTFLDGDWTNEATNIATIESNYSFTDVGFFKELQITHGTDNEKIIITDRCDDGELQRSIELIPSIGFIWQEVNNLLLLAQFLGLSVESIAWTPVVGANQVIANPFTPNLFVPIANQNGDGSVISVTSVTGGTDGALVADDDYSIVNQGGIFGIVMNTVAWGTLLTTLAQTITIVYDYTPSVANNLSYKRNQKVIPWQLFKFVTCKNANWEQDTYYLVDGKVNAEIVLEFVNQKTTDFNGSPMSFEVADWGNFFENKKTLS